MFRTILGIAMVSLIATAALAIPEPMVEPPNDVHQGTVMAVTQDSVMLMDDRDNEMETIAVTPQTKIIFAGQPATLDEIQMGDRATVTALAVNNKLVALTISALRPK